MIARGGLLAGLSPLRHRDFAMYWVAQLISHVGSIMEVTATSWLLYTLTGSPFLLGIAGLFRAAPLLAFSLLGGTVADRVGARRVLWFTQTAFAATSFALGGLVTLQAIQSWHVLLASLAYGLILSFDAPARQAMFPRLVPPGEVSRAVALHSTIRFLATVSGPAIAGPIIEHYDVAPVYYVNGASFGLLLIALVLVRTQDSARTSGKSLLGHTAEGLAYIRRDPLIATTLLLIALLSGLGHSPALLTIYARDVLQGGPTSLGWLLSSVGAGAVLGSLLLVLAFGGLRSKGMLFLATSMLYSVAMLTFGVSQSLALSLLAGFIMGLGQAGWAAISNAIVQVASPDHMRGRVMAVHVLVSRGFDSLSALQAGVLVGLLGPTAAVVLAAVGMGVSVCVAGARVASLRGFQDSGSPRPSGHG